MAEFDHFEFYKELYFTENERRSEVVDSLNIPLAIVTALVAGMYVLITGYPFEAELTNISPELHTKLSLIFIALTIISFCLLVVSVIYQCKAFINIENWSFFSYQTIPYAQTLSDWHTNLVTFYHQQLVNQPQIVPDPVTEATRLADVDLKNYLIREFIDAVDQNNYVNEKKLTDVSKSKRFLISSLFFSVFSLFPYGYAFFNKKDEIHKVDIQNKVYKVDIQDNPKHKTKAARPCKRNKKMSKSKLSIGPTKTSGPRYTKSNPNSTQSGQYMHRSGSTLSVIVVGKPEAPRSRMLSENKYPDEPPGYVK